MIGSRMRCALLATVGALALPAAANAATLSVDDDGVDCPAAPYASVQEAIDAAAPGDTVAICPGTYEEGPGTPTTNALTIDKSLTLKGAGADLVSLGPPVVGSSTRIAAPTPALRDVTGNIVTIAGAAEAPIDVQISGITFDGNGVYVENGVVFVDAGGSVVRSRITDVVTSEQAGAEDVPGGFRQNTFGYGVAQVTRATSAPATPERALLIDHTRIEKYNKSGVLIDGATNDTPPLTASGVLNTATVKASQIVGRTKCINFDVNGNCSSPGLITTGTLYGQNGVTVTAGASAAISSSILTQNLVNGSGAPVPSTNSTTDSTNNANLTLGAGLRLVGAGQTTLSRSNVVDNAYGALNLALDGASANTTTAIAAESNWWGLRTNASTNSGPAISPTTNPPVPENPVNGTAIVDGAGTSSDAVDFYPFRSGAQSDPNNGEYVIADAPIPVDDAGPTIALAADAASYEHGDTISVEATADDDFGVKRVTFYDGASEIATDATPPYTASLAVADDAACGARSISALAEDSLGQTAADDVEVTVVDPVDQCLAKPTVSLSGAPATISEAPISVGAVASSPASVTGLDYFLGERLVCAGLAEGASCEISPTGADVGEQTLRVVLTDSLGRTASDSASVTVDRFNPHELTLLRKHRSIRGRVIPPAAVSEEQGCGSGSVTVTAKAKGKTLLGSVQLAIDEECRYSVPLKYRGKKKSLRLSASFGGNTVLKPISKKRSFK